MQRSLPRSMCVFLGGVCVWGWGVCLSGRSVRPSVWEREAWGLPRSCYLGCSSRAEGERERQAEETRLRGDGTGAQLHFHFCRISTVASFFSVSLHSTEWVKERERAIERERVKEKIKPIFFKTRSWLSYKQMLPVIWSLSRHIDRTILTCFLLFMVLLQGKSISHKHGNVFFPIRCFYFFFK